MALGDVLQSFASPGEIPTGLTWDGTDLWNSDANDGTIYRLDPADGSILQSFVQPGGNTRGLAWDGTNLWNADTTTDTIYKLDPSDGSTLQSFASPGPNPRGLTWDGTDLWNSDANDGTIYRLDPADGSILQSFSSPDSNPQGLGWDGTDLWHADEGGTIYRLDPSDGSVLDSFSSPGAAPNGLTWDGTDLWNVDPGTDTIYRLEANLDPTAAAGADQTVDEGTTVNLDGTGSSDPEGRSLSYEWTVQDDDGTGLVDSDISNRLTDSASFIAPEVVGPDAAIVIQLEVTDDVGNTDTDTVAITVSDTNAFIDHIGTGGVVLGGEADQEFQRFVLLEHTGSGGLVLGGEGEPSFFGPQVSSDIVVECDFDNDGDFDEPEEDITTFVLALETRTGRDWPSLLTGKAGPGQLRCTLDNDDNRFSFFNADSPLNAENFSLRTGRKVRVRTVGSASPDPQLLARDRFNRPSFASGGPITWTQSVGTWDTTDGDTAAGATSTDQEHIAVTNIGVDDYYAQVTIRSIGRDTDNVEANELGLIYRYQDSDNYSLIHLRSTSSFSLSILDVVDGSRSLVTQGDTEVYDQTTIGVLVSGGSVTAYQEGVAVMSGTSTQPGETQVGMYAFWGVGTGGSEQPRPELDDFYVWTGLPAEVEGIIWTGNVSDLISDVRAGSLKLARLEGRGVLSRPAGQSISPTRSSEGRRTGLLVGNTLAQAGLLHPPCTEIERGDVTTGPVAIDEIQATEALRRFEEAEFGFLKESNEGYICYESRTARDQATPQAVLSDAGGAQLAYHHIEPKDWRREIFNRVRSGISPRRPAEITVTFGSIDQAFNSNQRFEVVMPSTVNAGDLLIVAASASSGIDGQPEEWFIPPGWKELTDKDLRGQDFDPYDDSRVYVKVADGTEGGTQIAFAETTESTQDGSGVAHVFRIPDGQWYGDLAGVHLGEQGIASSDAPALLVPWALRPTLLIAFRWGIEGSPITEGTPEPPIGYENVGILTEQDQDADSGIQSAWKIDVVTVEDPSQWFGTYTGWAQVDSGVIAIRAAERGDPVQSDSVDSQDEHNAIKTYRNTANLFATEADAEVYNNLVLGRHANDRPIVAVSFWATKHAALRAQAIRRRVSDMITLQAANKAGLGIDDDFYIESINHRWSKGTTLWETTWELSPAPARFIASSGDSSGSDSVTVAEPDGATTGDVLIGVMWSQEDPGSAPSGWTQIGSTLQVGDDYGSVWMIERGPSAPDLTWTNSSPNPLMMVGVLAYRGFSATPVDTATSAAGSQTSPSVTATDTGQWLLSVYHDAGTGLPVTHPSGMTLRYDGALDQESFVADQIAVDSGPTGTRSWSDGNTALGCWSLILNTL